MYVHWEAKHTCLHSVLFLSENVIGLCFAVCPSQQVYSNCVGSCPFTCEDLWPHTQCLQGPCTPGCTCPPGQVCTTLCAYVCVKPTVSDCWLYHCILCSCCMGVPACFVPTVPVQHSLYQMNTKAGMWAPMVSLKLYYNLEQLFSTSVTHGNTLKCTCGDKEALTVLKVNARFCYAW